MFKFILIVELIILVKAKTIFQDDSIEWNEFKLKFDKKYLNIKDEKSCKNNYFKNKEIVQKHNFLFKNDKFKSWNASLNEYSDMTWTEFNMKMNGLNTNYINPVIEIFKPSEHFIAPEELDYRKKGYVTEIKNQRLCGSCWAFSATGSIEGQVFKKNKTLVSLSEQNLIDCSAKYGNHGCYGGLMNKAFKYIIENHGIDTEDSYTYEALNDECRYNETNKGAEISDYVGIQYGNDDALLQALVQVGPISVVMFADENFMNYSSGVFESEGCMGKKFNHGVLLIGYGTDKQTGKKYWLLKNSWGTSWGEDGYFRLSREIKNNCGISIMASYPII